MYVCLGSRETFWGKKTRDTKRPFNLTKVGIRRPSDGHLKPDKFLLDTNI